MLLSKVYIENFKKSLQVHLEWNKVKLFPWWWTTVTWCVEWWLSTNRETGVNNDAHIIHPKMICLVKYSYNCKFTRSRHSYSFSKMVRYCVFITTTTEKLVKSFAVLLTLWFSCPNAVMSARQLMEHNCCAMCSSVIWGKTLLPCAKNVSATSFELIQSIFFNNVIYL